MLTILGNDVLRDVSHDFGRQVPTDGNQGAVDPDHRVLEAFAGPVIGVETFLGQRATTY
jgi:hypothetical protein